MVYSTSGAESTELQINLLSDCHDDLTDGMGFTTPDVTTPHARECDSRWDQTFAILWWH